VPSPFRLLLKLFRNRFFESDTVTPGGGFETSIYQVLGTLITIGLVVSYLAIPQFLALSLRPVTAGTEWGLRLVRLAFCAYSFGAAGFAAVFYWDTLFPDRRDFLTLTPFPIRLRELAGAKILALLSFLLLMIAAINVAPDLLFGLAMFIPGVRGAGVLMASTQVAATWGASLFGFLGVTAIEGVLLTFTSVRSFRRISPWVQMLAMSVMVLSFVGFPFYGPLFVSAVVQREVWIFLFPPAWFSGLYELMLGGRNGLLVSLGVWSIGAIAISIMGIGLTWGLGFRRHLRRTLESADTPHRPRMWKAPRWLVRAPEERAIFGFVGKTLGRSQKHQFFLAAYLSAGISVAAFFAAAVRGGQLALSADGARAAAFALGFFFISGFRVVFQFPAELNANWIFRMTEARWTEVSRNATRKIALAIGVLPPVLLMLPLEIAAWKWPVALEHAAVQGIAAALLVEAMFWNFDKVPFTCSYFPGRKSVALLIVLYVYGLTGYSFNLADGERLMEQHGQLALLVFPLGLAGLIGAWRRRPRDEAVRFDGREPEVQTLDLY